MVLGVLCGIALFVFLGIYTKRELDRMIEIEEHGCDKDIGGVPIDVHVEDSLNNERMEDSTTPPEEIAEMVPLKPGHRPGAGQDVHNPRGCGMDFHHADNDQH